ncbi:MAG: citramalate synthase, partial [Candidatus Omnitrophica bacterium]|nr:citramalate synthase [Candidatus Omnitrophota bacterium]
MAENVVLYDTTLRDGAQGEGISLSVTDKLRITQRLDKLGMHYIEGGWPANPKDLEFFKKVRGLPLKNSTVAAFGSTRRAHGKVSEDFVIKGLLAAKSKVITLFGKSWDLHVQDVLRTSLDENVNMIRDSVEYLKGKRAQVFYDAEHFFDAYKANPDYAMRTIQAAEHAGADVIILCDTNGGTLPERVAAVVRQVASVIKVPLGIHTHN